jgi:hypothetical protein
MLRRCKLWFNTIITRPEPTLVGLLLPSSNFNQHFRELTDQSAAPVANYRELTISSSMSEFLSPDRGKDMMCTPLAQARIY